ncbi:hypothetical protein A134_23235 [Vibrio crassostreae 9CS106]|uniref:Uncharacterized protein n=1 Tax=Vibrio crassostreae 9CS106 TaxID=1191300 RepID=A0A1B1C397_9VIBR|nr:hypothetical protein A134_23235 [Vibrio crassostreae 9CS106]
MAISRLAYFGDNPHMLKSLQKTKGVFRTLQARERLSAVVVMSGLLVRAQFNGSVGVPDGQAEQHENAGLLGVSHKDIIGYATCLYGVDMSKGVYYRMVNKIKLAGYLTVTACRTIKSGDKTEPNWAEACEFGLVKSVAAIKEIPDKFFEDLGINKNPKYLESKLDSAKRFFAKGYVLAWKILEVALKSGKRLSTKVNHPTPNPNVPYVEEDGYFQDASILPSLSAYETPT